MTLLKEREVAALINMSVHWLRRKRSEGGGIPYEKLGERGAVRYREEDVRAFIEERVQRSTSDVAEVFNADGS